jgi:drug/metabolite transporter (DMT)-like permease
MSWLPIAFLTAFSLSTADALSKKALSETDDLVIVWVREGYSLPFLASALLFVDIPHLDATFWVTVLILLPLEVAALILYVKAIRLSPLSLSVPFLALSPVFILFIAFFILGEVPTTGGLVGVFLIALGAYLLNASASRYGLLGPIRAISKEPGSMLMIVVSIIYGITSTLGKVAIEHSNPVFFGFFYPFVLTVVLTFVVLRRGRLKGVVSRPGTFLPIGFFSAVMVITHFVALGMTQVAYLISIKRTSLVFSVLYGRLLFKEVNIRERLLGAVVMAAGVALIALF